MTYQKAGRPDRSNEPGVGAVSASPQSLMMVALFEHMHAISFHPFLKSMATSSSMKLRNYSYQQLFTHQRYG